jgi:hypothetical protein
MVLAMALFAAIFAFAFSGQWSLADLVLNNVKKVAAQHIGERVMEEIFMKENESVLSDVPPTYESLENAGPFDIDYTVFGKPFDRCTNTHEYSASWGSGWGSSQSLVMSKMSVDLGLVLDFGLDCARSYFPSFESLSEEVVVADSLVTSVDALNNFVFISQNSLNGIVRINASDNFEQVVIPNPPQVAGLNKIDVTNDFVFAAANSTTSQVVVFRNGDALEFVATTTLPGVTGSRPEAVSIFYSDSRLYVGTKRTAGHEFHVFDVTDPQSPEWMGSREINHNINDIFVKDGFAFLATSGNVRDMIVVDVSDPAFMIPSLVLDLPGNEDGRSIEVGYNYIFLGRHKSVVPDRPELYVLKYFFEEVSRVMSVEIVDSVKTGGDVIDVGFSQGRVFAATNNILKEFQVFGFSDSFEIQPEFYQNLFFAANGFDMQGRKFFVSVGNEVHIFQNHE